MISIVARGDVAYEFYTEPSFIDFGYIFTLKSKHSPQGSGLNLCSGTANTITPGLLVILLHHREYRWGLGEGGEWRQHGRYVISKLQKTASFMLVESLDVPPQRARARARTHAHTHIHTHTFTYTLPPAFILPKDSRG